MVTYIIYTNKSGSFIVPKAKAKLPKEFSASFEIDSPFEICSRRCRLAKPVNTEKDVQGVLVRLFEKVKKDGNAKEKIS